MLDRTRLIAQIQKVSDSLFPDFSQEYDIARVLWQQIARDPTFIHRIRAVRGQMPWPVPLWEGVLDEVVSIDQTKEPYLGLSVDGSQIYPDRHQGTGCFLINIGSVALGYGMPSNTIFFDSVPYVFAGDLSGDMRVTPDYVNGIRQEFEFQGGLELVARYADVKETQATVFLFDGSLIFWHLASQQQDLKQLFLGKYIALLTQWQAANVLLAGYISLPKSKELVSLLRCALCNFDPKGSDAYKAIDHLVDSSIAHFFLKPGTRTIVFKNMSDICEEYPASLQPHFFYLHVGSEIVRIEIPAWIAQSSESINTIARVALDQCVKGQGYPVLIAEAHEQAVVKGPDRDFFYQVITKIGIERSRRPVFSAKSMKKRGMGI